MDCRKKHCNFELKHQDVSPGSESFFRAKYLHFSTILVITFNQVIHIFYLFSIKDAGVIEMRKFVRGAFLTLVLSFLLAAFILSGTKAQQNKWVTYHGDFCNFDIRYDYELDYTHKGRVFKYLIYDPQDKDNKLLISSGHMRMDFKLGKKRDYKTQYTGAVKVKNTLGNEQRGVTPDDKHWREAYLYFSTRGAMGPDTSLIYVKYDGVSGEQSIIFNKIIDSIEVRDPIQIEMPPNQP